MSEQEAKAYEARGFTAWHSGGGHWLAIKQHANGLFDVLGDWGYEVYASRADFDSPNVAPIERFPHGEFTL